MNINQKQKSNDPKPIFIKWLWGAVFILFFGLFLLWRSSKNKQEYYKISGRIILLEKYFEAEKKSKKGKHRYLKIDSHQEIMRLFIGKDFGDFSPSFEKIDSLKIGDLIDIFYATETPFQRNTSISELNTTVQFIDKNNRPFFIRGTKDKYGSYFFIITGIASIIFLLFLKRKRLII